MAVLHVKTGKWLDLPWGQKYELFLVSLEDTTHRYEGEELLHQIHIEAMTTKWIQIRFYKRIRLMLAACITLLAAILLLLMIR
jgi:hypothetical protein